MLNTDPNASTEPSHGANTQFNASEESNTASQPNAEGANTDRQADTEADATAQTEAGAGQTPPPGGDPTANNTDEEPAPPSHPKRCKQQICYEDLGVQMGVEGNKKGLDNHIEFIKREKSEAREQYSNLLSQANASLDKYRADLSTVVESDLLGLLKKVEKEQTEAMKRLLSYSEVFNIVTKRTADQERVNKILDVLLEEQTNILAQAHRELLLFKNALREAFHHEVLGKKHQQHLDALGQQAHTVMQTWTIETDLMRGYDYGESVRRFLGGDNEA